MWKAWLHVRYDYCRIALCDLIFPLRHDCTFRPWMLWLGGCIDVNLHRFHIHGSMAREVTISLSIDVEGLTLVNFVWSFWLWFSALCAVLLKYLDISKFNSASGCIAAKFMAKWLHVTLIDNVIWSTQLPLISLLYYSWLRQPYLCEGRATETDKERPRPSYSSCRKLIDGLTYGPIYGYLLLRVSFMRLIKISVLGVFFLYMFILPNSGY